MSRKKGLTKTRIHYIMFNIYKLQYNLNIPKIYSIVSEVFYEKNEIKY